MAKRKKSPPPAAIAAAAIVWLLAASSCVVEEGEPAEVRYTWERAEQFKIERVYASYNDVKYWRDNVYGAYYYDREDATGFPMHVGSGKIPDNIYSNATGSVEYKGKYLPIREGKYTAVCGGEDAHGRFDIVANYEIAVVGGLRYFEVAFDVGALTGGKEDPWFFERYDNPDDPPRLRKAPGGGRAVKIERGGVTYYVLRRR